MVVGRKQRTPTLPDVFEKILGSFELDLHTALPARVEAYDNSNQTVDVQPGIQEILTTDAGEPVPFDPPILYDVPVAFPRAGDYFISFPLSAGDFVLLVFCERPLDQWRELGDGSRKAVPPGLRSLHDFNGAVAIPGIYPSGLKLTETANTTMVMGQQGGQQIKIRPARVDVGVSGSASLQFVALANKVLAELQVVASKFNPHVHVSAAPGSASGPPIVLGPTGPAQITPSPVASTNLKAEE